MNILNIIKSAGTRLIKDVVPGGGLAIAAINALLPGGTNIPEDATGDDLEAAVNSLPADQRESILSKQIDLKITESNNWASIQDAHATADASGSSTRPEIAMMMAKVVALSVLLNSIALLAAVLLGNQEVIKALSDAWPLILAILGTPTILLKAYFGLRTQEKKARYAASIGSDAGAGGIASSLIQAFARR